MNEMVHMRRGWSHVKRMVTCEPGCGCENWMDVFELDVVICE